MLHRRFVVSGGLAALGASSICAPIAAFGQSKPPVKVRYNEVVRSVLYAPAYAAITKGYFKDAGLDVELTTGGAGDKTMAALLSGSADIALAGPETTIYVLNSDSSVKARIFCGLTATDGFMLVGRTKVDKFDWSVLKGRLGFNNPDGYGTTVSLRTENYRIKPDASGVAEVAQMYGVARATKP